ncbi:MAG: DEAD/DEAH box helicase family protein [Campylobacteraceae bacterium]|jgi:type III restriction enzyme|nr:DEAD/DEAH box helicase family protein [Campylobacteraceae bacterium]
MRYKQTDIPIKEFRYDLQPYQEECIANIIDIFRQLSFNKPFSKVIFAHMQNSNYTCSISSSKNIDILMETGTGKTFTFIKTIFELNKNFGYKKFIILVPSVAIREGTQANFNDTKSYFKSYYAGCKDTQITPYIYQSGIISEVEQFISNLEQLSCLVMTPASFNARDNILNRPLEKDLFHPANSYLELLKLLNPIVVIDEPHKFEGEAFKRYFEGFDNYYLRFGATFPQMTKNSVAISLSNTAYILDSISSFRQNLVKQITVHTQDIINAQQSIAGFKDKEVLVNNFVNGRFYEQTTLKSGNTFNGKLIVKILKNKIVLNTGEIITKDYNLTDDAIRVMLADAIGIHFEKEIELFSKSIKALTLFFIEHIAQYRDVQNPTIKTIFEEEYQKAREAKIDELKDKPQYKEYLAYLNKDYEDGYLQVHKGYFSGDRGNSDEKIKQGVDEILKDKKKLLSFESSTRFIFSIWALQEGWDNPNVFTICKLSDYGSETSKLQQIGRGLRICVDQNLQRQNLKLFNGNQEEFWKINNLDIVISNQETGFVEAIQNEILKNSHLLNDTFTEEDLRQIIREKLNIDNDRTVRKIIDILDTKNLIVFNNNNNTYSKSQTYLQDVSKLESDEYLTKEHIKILGTIFAEDIKQFVKNVGVQKKKKIRIKDKYIEEFKQLWQIINQNSFYLIDNLTVENENILIEKIAEEINNLTINKIFLSKKKTVMEASKLEGRLSITEEESSEYNLKIDYFALVENLSSASRTPLSFTVKIINALTKEFKQNMLKNDIAQAQVEMTAVIKKHLIDSIKTRIDYCGINGSVLNTGVMYDKQGNFAKELPAGSLGKIQEDLPRNFSLKEEWLFEDILEYDSSFEKEIILNDPKIENIKIFGKMPKLEISTPLGKYNPDFCYAIEGENGKKVFLIVESKGYDTQTAIPQDEQSKIDFAEKFFDKVNEKYRDKNIKVVYEKRINTTNLSSLITKAISGQKEQL